MLIELQPKAAAPEAVRRLARALTGRTATAADDKTILLVILSKMPFLKGAKQA